MIKSFIKMTPIPIIIAIGINIPITICGTKTIANNLLENLK
jgi:hypothetical protein